jgi:signal transduction histidine kinase
MSAVSVARCCDAGACGHPAWCQKSLSVPVPVAAALVLPILAAMSLPPATTLPAPMPGAGAVGSGRGLGAWRELLEPLHLAAYAVLGLIAYSQLVLVRAGPAWPWQLATLAVFLVAWMVLGPSGSRGLSHRRQLLLAALLATMAIANIALVFDGMNPILLVLVASQLPMLMSVPRAIAVLVLLDAVFYLLLRDHHGQSRSLFTVAVYASFQVFALLMSWYAIRAERSNRELAQVNAHLLATRSLLEEGARDGERLRLSRELHDVAGHSLTALKLHLELAQRLPEPDQRQQRVAAALALADALLEDIRGVVGHLRRYDGIDLPAALSVLCAGFAGVDIDLQVPGDLRLGQVERAETLLRVVQEALTNAVRHGRARRIAVVVQRDSDRVRVRVEDDGRGRVPVRHGNGLTGMAERLAGHGGTLQLVAAAAGLRLDADLLDPLPVPA